MRINGQNCVNFFSSLSVSSVRVRTLNEYLCIFVHVLFLSFAVIQPILRRKNRCECEIVAVYYFHFSEMFMFI